MMVCEYLGCGQYARIMPGRTTGYCWLHYREYLDNAGHPDWCDELVKAEAQRLGLTPARDGETLRAYMLRHGIMPESLTLYERIPGSDDDA